MTIMLLGVGLGAYYLYQKSKPAEVRAMPSRMPNFAPNSGVQQVSAADDHRPANVKAAFGTVKPGNYIVGGAPGGQSVYVNISPAPVNPNTQNGRSQ